MEQQRADKAPPHFYSTEEWAKRLGRSIATALRMINAASKDGQVDRVIVQVKTQSKTYPVAHYRIKGLR